MENSSELSNIDPPPIKISLIQSVKEAQPIYNIHICKILSEAKNKIDDNKDWDKGKKLSNEYELVHIPFRKKKNDSIANYIPLSRSYFKMWEMINDYKLLESEKELKIATIAEGPGGFIEAINNYRKSKKKKDNIYGITLKSVKNDIPGWRKAREFLNKNPNIQIHYGEDNTGNIYNVNNIKSFRNYVGKNTVDLVTADGGFDFSIDFNKQEQLSYRIIFCEIITAFSIQKRGGKFICKIFDMYTSLTVNMIYLLSLYYTKVTITKPKTSRQANSEKYIVATGFRGINESDLNHLYSIVKEWDICEKKNLYVQNIFINEPPREFINQIVNYNKDNAFKQLENILKTLNIIRRKESNFTAFDIRTIISNQINLALEWCKKYNIDINKESKYLKEKSEETIIEASI